MGQPQPLPAQMAEQRSPSWEAARLQSPQQPSSRPAGCLPSPSLELGPLPWDPMDQGAAWASPMASCLQSWRMHPTPQGLWASLPPCLLSQARHQWEHLGGPSWVRAELLPLPRPAGASGHRLEGRGPQEGDPREL